MNRGSLHSSLPEAIRSSIHLSPLTDIHPSKRRQAGGQQRGTGSPRITTTTTIIIIIIVPEMSFLLVTVLSSLLVPDADAWGANVKYAVNCPDRCNAERCGSGGGSGGSGGGGGGTQRCARTVLDDCGCCQVCAAGRGEHCYRTVSGMHGVKCGPGLFCEFYKDEDDYGDEYGICKDCLYGTYGVECRKTCNCKGGICDRETGACLTLKFFAKIASKLKSEPQAGGDEGSGEVGAAQSTDQHTDRSSAPKRLNPR